MNTQMKPCCHPGCTDEAIIQVEGERWMCAMHMTEWINEPENIALTQADEDLERFRSEGGKVS